MKLDPKTGTLVVGAREIGPEMKTLRGVADEGRAWMIIARASGGRLAQITLVCEDASFGAGWDDYTEEKEHARRAVHDAFLERDLGPAHRTDDEHFSKEWTLP